MECCHREALPQKDSEGGSYIIYGEEKHSFKAETWAAGGKLQSEMYGIRLPNIRNLRLDGVYEEVGPGKKVSFQVTQGETMFSIAVNDGICLYSDDEPDYKVVAIYPYSHLTLEVEKL